ncbi:uncharacterized protein N7469_007445 [Penicillium citrinum]|uniref:Uncharacterized protein n=2 Tax=Penicillium TaxID=5073 RepID=A0A9W9NZ90_PENCI|nr:uncharacterized protein N7469_007445 [Penicillium citrinum]KAJ5227439.1 hypothetical protein N7469_007445 [Penicillium citrinum]KAJ5568087.1 hypothetical protein N7450_010573 [Penicillium hetheringtonii]
MGNMEFSIDDVIISKGLLGSSGVLSHEDPGERDPDQDLSQAVILSPETPRNHYMENQKVAKKKSTSSGACAESARAMRAGFLDLRGLGPKYRTATSDVE